MYDKVWEHSWIFFGSLNMANKKCCIKLIRVEELFDTSSIMTLLRIVDGSTGWHDIKFCYEKFLDFFTSLKLVFLQRNQSLECQK